jgi:hypothetical protein
MTIKSGMLTMRRRQKKEVIFRISIKDGFYDTPINETAEATVTTWTAFVYSRVGSKPKKTIGAFSKSRLLFLKKAMALTTNIPVQFNVPQIKVESQY